jgi:hypothetical protein
VRRVPGSTRTFRSLLRALVVVVPLLACAAVVSVASSARSSPAAPAQLPDLDQEIPSQMQVVAGRSGAGSYRLGFQSAVRNVGDGPLVIRGRRDWPALPEMTADQVVVRADGSQGVVARVGALRYVESSDHRHWHYLGFDRYELRRAGSATALVQDQKTGFCLGDRYPVQTRQVPNAAPAPVYVGRCGLGDTELTEIEEGISVGYGDNYRAFLEYQDLPLDGLTDGEYVLVHSVNGDRRIQELSYANNASSVLFDLRWRRGLPYLRLLRACPDSARCDVPPPGTA